MLTRKISTIVTVLVAVLLVAASVTQAYDYSNSTRAPFSYTGKITAIDSAYKILTVQAGPNKETYFDVRDDATLLMCDKIVSFSDLKVGDMVTITFYQESLGGTNYVTEIDSGMRC